MKLGLQFTGNRTALLENTHVSRQGKTNKARLADVCSGVAAQGVQFYELPQGHLENPLRVRAQSTPYLGFISRFAIIVSAMPGELTRYLLIWVLQVAEVSTVSPPTGEYIPVREGLGRMRR